MATKKQTKPATKAEFDSSKTVEAILKTIPNERNREIVRRRLGLFGPAETLDSIGQDLSLTRERIRQIAGGAMAELKANIARHDSRHLRLAEARIKTTLKKIGNIGQTREVTKHLVGGLYDRVHQAQITFLARLSPEFVVIDPSPHHHAGIGLTSHHSHQEVHQHISAIVDHLGDLGSPATSSAIGQKCLPKLSSNHIHGLASLSKQLAFLENVWGLHRWPTVNPGNIADKIYLILRQSPEPLHFREIARRIQTSKLRRSDVTTEAVHNELIRHDRFVLVARGKYALREHGYEHGTVADIIAKILQEAKKPMDRDEIVSQVLKQRFVKETTIILNLQSKPQFRRQAGTSKYDLDANLVPNRQ